MACRLQKAVELPPYPRGCHVITRKLLQHLPELAEFEVGLANIFVCHTSCSLTINENASPDVPLDLNDDLNRLVPESNHYRHLDEGPDDMVAHVKVGDTFPPFFSTQSVAVVKSSFA
jgi:secondary thiamine-phosphate synthase enzyme